MSSIADAVDNTESWYEIGIIEPSRSAPLFYFEGYDDHGPGTPPAPRFGANGTRYPSLSAAKPTFEELTALSAAQEQGVAFTILEFFP